MKINKWNLELGEAIQKLGKYEDIDIWSRFHNKLDSIWGRNYKDKIKIETLMEIPVKPYEGMKENYQSNFYFTITPEQAHEMIALLKKLLRNRKKRK